MVVHTKLSMEELESAASAFGISARMLDVRPEIGGITIAADTPEGVEFLEHLVERTWAERRF
jgi:hypothetical protein